MIERALQVTFRHLTTLVLLVGAISLPLHVIYAVSFRDVIAVDALHHRIAALPEGREIAGVDSGLLAESQSYFLLLEGIELVAALILVGGVVRILEDDASGRLPTVGRALSGVTRHRVRLNLPGRLWVSVIACALIAAAVGYLTEVSLVAASDVLNPEDRWALIALARALARALSVPFVLVPLALASGSKGKTASVPNLY